MTNDYQEEMNLVHYRFADDFCTHLSYSVKTIAIREHIQNVLNESIQLNAIDLLNDALKATWMQMTQKEKAEFCKRYLKTMKTVVEADGTIRLKIDANS